MPIHKGITYSLLSVGIFALGATASTANANTITEIVNGDENFSTLNTALEVTGLDDTLNGTTEYTVFAPTNDAFANLPKGLVDSLVVNPDILSNVLLYHVVAGEVDAATVVGLTEAETALGENVDITVDGSTVMINDATVTMTDVQADNGIVHVIDSVLVPTTVDLPPAQVQKINVVKKKPRKVKVRWPEVSGADRYKVVVRRPNGKLVYKKMVDNNRTTLKDLKPDTKYTVTVQAMDGELKAAKSYDRKFKTKEQLPTITETAVSTNKLSTLVDALVAAELDSLLNDRDGGPYTVFAPTNAAFNALPDGTLESLLANPDQLTEVLTYHVVAGKKYAKNVVNNPEMTTVQGEQLNLSDIELNTTDIKTGNGVVHIIDNVLLPPSMQ